MARRKPCDCRSRTARSKARTQLVTIVLVFLIVVMLWSMKGN